MSNEPTYQGSPSSGGNPGQVLGIVSIVLGVTGCLAIVGLVLGFVSRSKSKRAGASTTLGVVGIVVSAIALVLGIAFAALIAAGVANAPWDQITEGVEQCEQGATSYEVDGVVIECP